MAMHSDVVSFVVTAQDRSIPPWHFGGGVPGFDGQAGAAPQRARKQRRLRDRAMAWSGSLILLATSMCVAGMPTQKAWAARRYALVVGNNHGATTQAELRDLSFAERDAEHIAEHLVSHGRFKRERVILLRGVGRDPILAAAKRLADQVSTEADATWDHKSICAFFFHGHGLGDALLTQDEPLGKRELGQIFEDFECTLEIGFFDACNAGGLTTKGPQDAVQVWDPQGLVPEPDLKAKGTLWFFSSEDGMPSFEHPGMGMGGLFSHFFIEAFTHAPDTHGGDASGAIDLLQMFLYAKERTSEHAQKFLAEQTAGMRQCLDRDFEYFGIPFSFPSAPTATLQLKHLSNIRDLILYYGAGAYPVAESVDALPLTDGKVPILPGRLRLGQAGVLRPQEDFEPVRVRPGDEVRLQPKGAAPPVDLLGWAWERADTAAQLTDGIDVYKRSLRSMAYLVAGYGASPSVAPNKGLLQATQRATAGAMWASGPWLWGGDLGYGRQQTHHQGWRYDLQEIALRARGGVGFEVGRTQLDLDLTVEGLLFRTEYGDGETGQRIGFSTGLGPCWRMPLPYRNPWILLVVGASANVRWLPGAAAESTHHYWTANPAYELGLMVPWPG